MLYAAKQDISHDESITLRIQALDSFISKAHLEKADALHTEIAQEALSDEQQIALNLLQAKIALLKHQPRTQPISYSILT